MSRLVAYLGLGNIPLFLFKVTRETATRFYGDMVERVDGREPGWWYVTGFVHRQQPGKSYMPKNKCVPVANRASWDQCKPVMQHAIEAKEIELKRIDALRRRTLDNARDMEDVARLCCSETCLVELRKDV